MIEIVATIEEDINGIFTAPRKVLIYLEEADVIEIAKSIMEKAKNEEET